MEETERIPESPVNTESQEAPRENGDSESPESPVNTESQEASGENEDAENTDSPESTENTESQEASGESEAEESFPQDESPETSESSEDAETETETETESETETETETETESETEIDIEQIINDAVSSISASSPEASDYSGEITQLHAETIEHFEKLEAYAKASFTSSVALLVTAMFTAGVTIGHSFWSRLRGG